MSVFVKICGLTTAADVAAAIDAGADAIGFVFAESPRRVSVDAAVGLVRDVPAGVVRVAVMRHPTVAEFDAVIDGFRPDWVQADAADLAHRTLHGPMQALPVFRDVAGLDEASVSARPRVLFEAARSGAGESVDRQRAARLARTTELVLAGGLDADNVAAAIRDVHPWGVDVSSGVERRRGEKDAARIAAFVSAVRELEN